MFGVGSEYGIDTVGATLLRTTLEIVAVSVESSLYVTVIFPPLTSIFLTTSDLFSNAVPFLDDNLSSVLVLEYSILIWFLIFSISEVVRLLISSTPILSPSISGCWMLYLYVWDLTTNLK